MLKKYWKYVLTLGVWVVVCSTPVLTWAHPGDEEKFSAVPQFEGYSDSFVLMVNSVGWRG